MMLKMIRKTLVHALVLMLVLCLLPLYSSAEVSEDHWVRFMLVCNEGMSNSGGNVGNTMMVVSMNTESGIIRLMAFTWDSFVDYEGYDVPQKIDMAYRNNGPQETMKVFNQNFGLDIERYLSLNFSNLYSLIDEYGGVNVDISRAERNALNSMVASKKDSIQAQADMGFVNQLLVEMIAEQTYLNEYGPDTHLTGMQAIAYGWLQYDSVYNCCLRELKVISDLFSSVADSIGEKAVFYTDDTGIPARVGNRRAINVENMTDDDITFLQKLVSPIFQMSYNNMEEEDIRSFTAALAQNAYRALRQGVNIFKSVDCQIFPLEALNEYDRVAGTSGHLVDRDANTEAMKAFLFNEDW